MTVTAPEPWTREHLQNLIKKDFSSAQSSGNYEDKLALAQKVCHKQWKHASDSLSKMYDLEGFLKGREIFVIPMWDELDESQRNASIHTIKKAYQIFLHRHDEYRCEIVQQQLQNMLTYFTTQDVPEIFTTPIRKWICVFENTKANFAQKKADLCGKANNLIHLYLKKEEIGVGFYTGWNLLTWDYRDKYTLDALAGQPPLGSYKAPQNDGEESKA